MLVSPSWFSLVSPLAPHLSPKQRKDFRLISVVPKISMGELGNLVEWRRAVDSEAISVK